MIVLAPILLVLLLLCGCAGGLQDTGEAGPAVSIQVGVLQDIALPAEGMQPGAAYRRSVLETAMYEVNPQSYSMGSGASTGDYFEIEYALLEPPEGGLAWAVYSAEIPAGEKLRQIVADVDNEDLGDDEWLPDLPWWIGVADFSAQRWTWHGPFDDFYAQVDLDTGAPREQYVNPEGAAVWVVASHCAAGCTPAGMCIWAMDFGTEY